jgi:hypothetical protein
MRLQSISYYTLAIVISAIACTTSSEQSDVFRETFENLPSGVEVSVEISYPKDGDVFAAGDPIPVDGFATIGQASALSDTAVVFLVDVSGSTDNPANCGGDLNNDGDFDTVLDCEIEALLAVTQTARALGTVPHIGAAVFGTTGGAADMQPGATDNDELTAPDADLDSDNVMDVEEVLRSIQYGNIFEFTPRKVALKTSYGAGLAAVVPVLEASDAPNKVLIMVSDGDNNTSPAVDTVLPELPAGTVVHTFAIGNWAKCGDIDPLGNLLDISNATGGHCTEVPDVADLPDVLPEVIQAALTGLELRVDGDAIAIDDIDGQLPAGGPASIDYATTMWSLPAGEHELCATATGVDSIGSGDVTECVTIIVDSPPTVECQDHILVASEQCEADVSIADEAIFADGEFVDCVVEPAGPYPVGITDVTMTCVDEWGSVSECDTVVEVVDESPPQIEAQSLQLWPPNHEYQQFSASDCLGVVVDSCSEAELDIDGTAELLSVTSDEGHDDLGDGCTCADSIVIDGNNFKVRAERLANGNGRIYEATYKLTDEFGNESVASCQIEVPLTPNKPPLHDGQAVCVGDDCGVELSLADQCKNNNANLQDGDNEKQKNNKK